MKGLFRAKFWGGRGSHPVSRKDAMFYGGNTSCVEVRVKGHLIILDLGTGVIQLGEDLAHASEDKPVVAAYDGMVIDLEE